MSTQDVDEPCQLGLMGLLPGEESWPFRKSQQNSTGCQVTFKAVLQSSNAVCSGVQVTHTPGLVHKSMIDGAAWPLGSDGVRSCRSKTDAQDIVNGFVSIIYMWGS